MKPRLGRTVWCIYEWSLAAQKVYALGEQSFITDNYCKNTIQDSQEYEYDLYNYRWFTSLAKAKKKIMQEAWGKNWRYGLTGRSIRKKNFTDF